MHGSNRWSWRKWGQATEPCDGGATRSVTKSTTSTMPATTKQKAPAQGGPAEQVIDDAQKLMKAFI